MTVVKKTSPASPYKSVWSLKAKKQPTSVDDFELLYCQVRCTILITFRSCVKARIQNKRYHRCHHLHSAPVIEAPGWLFSCRASQILELLVVQSLRCCRHWPISKTQKIGWPALLQPTRARQPYRALIRPVCPVARHEERERARREGKKELRFGQI